MKRPVFPLRRTAAAAGFTLVELLAATCLFVLLVGVAFETVSLTSSATDRQARRLDATSSVRTALDTLSQDIYTFVRQNGATLLFKPGDSNEGDALKFLCLSRPEPEQARPRMTLVGYELDVSTESPSGGGRGLPALLRTNAPVSWPAIDDDAPADYDFFNVLRRPAERRRPVAGGVIRLEIIWLGSDGVISRLPRGATTEGDGFHRVDPAKVIGFIAIVAAIDRRSERLAISTQAVNQARSVLSTLSEEDVAGGLNPYDLWMTRVGDIEDPTIRQHLLITQRTYYLPR
jgi:type II secretory pathway pseudopilin PulG